MTNEEIRKEFSRWISIRRDNVWCRYPHEKFWSLKNIPTWNETEIYIVDDKQAKLKKLQIDKPETQFQMYDVSLRKWVECTPTWNICTRYRIKPKEWYEDPDMIDKPVWVRDFKEREWLLRTFKNYEKDTKYPFVVRGGASWQYAKPVKPEDLYQGEKNDIN